MNFAIISVTLFFFSKRVIKKSDFELIQGFRAQGKRNLDVHFSRLGKHGGFAISIKKMFYKSHNSRNGM